MFINLYLSICYRCKGSKAIGDPTLRAHLKVRASYEKKLLTTVSNGTFYHSSISGILLSWFTLPHMPESIAPCELRRACSLQYRFTTLNNAQTVIKTFNYIVELFLLARFWVLLLPLTNLSLASLKAKNPLVLALVVRATKTKTTGFKVYWRANINKQILAYFLCFVQVFLK